MAVDRNLLTSIVASLTEQEAVTLALDIRRQFNWNVTIFQTEDIVMAFTDRYEREPTDDELNDIMATYYWRKMEDRMCEEGFECIGMAIDELGIEEEPDNQTGEQE